MSENKIYAEIRSAEDAVVKFGNKYMRRKSAEQKAEVSNPQNSAYTASTANFSSVSLSDDEIIGKLLKNDKASRLWNGDLSDCDNDDSKADYRLAHKIAFYTKDANQIDRIFRQSCLMREKWDRQDGVFGTYGARTINSALQRQTGQYDPQFGKKKKESVKPMKKTSEVPSDINSGGNSSFGELKLKDAQEELVFGIISDKLTADDLLYMPKNELELSMLIAHTIKDIFKYIPEIKMWYVWDSIKYVLDMDNCIIERAVEIFIKYALGILPSKQKLTDEDKKRLSEEEVEKIETKNTDIEEVERFLARFLRITEIRKLVKSLRIKMKANLSDFNTEPYKINLKDGVLDLKTMEFSPHKFEDNMTMVANVVYVPDATSEKFQKFISEVMMGDKETERFIQKALGYTLLGEAREECIFILLGLSTRNGKSTLVEVIHNILGDYSASLPVESLMQSRTGGAGNARPDITRLRDKRMVYTAEGKKNEYLNASYIKQLSGNDTIAARSLYQNDYTEFRPYFKVFMSTNNFPIIDDNSVFESNRLRIIPFNRHFSEEEQNKNLKVELSTEKEKSGIFNWLIQGLELYLEEGLGNTPAMNEIINQYCIASDNISNFIDDNYLKDNTSCTKLKDVWEKYVEWCKSSGVRKPLRRDFESELARVGVRVFERNHQKCTNLKLLSAEVENLNINMISAYNYKYGRY